MSETTPQRVPSAVIAEIRARTDLVALAQRTTALRRSGERFIGFCPFHDEKTPSFHVVPERGFFHCFGCGAHGGAIDFVMRAEDVGFREAVRRLAEAGTVPADGNTVRQPLRPVSPKHVNGSAEPARAARERAKAYRLWQGREPVADSVAEIYLVEARGLEASWARTCPVLGFAAQLDYWSTDAAKPERIWRGPALLAAMQGQDGSFAALHITWLRPDGGGKLDLQDSAGAPLPAKKVRGSPRRAAIRLTPPARRMVVGEGIETTASVFGVVPHGWAAYCLDNLCGAGLGSGPRDPRDRRRRLPSEIPDETRPGMLPPAECRHITYLGDGDTTDALMLERKLRRAVRRAQQLGMQADFAISPPGMDFNDLVRGTADDA